MRRGSAPRGRARADGGMVLPLVLAILLVAMVMVLALVRLSSTHLRAGANYRSRIDALQRNSDAVDFAVNATRNNRDYGRDGDSRTWTSGSVVVTCVGKTDSGKVVGFGRMDRTVVCTSPLIRTTVRYFDRAGQGNGVVVEQLDWTVIG